VGEEGELKAKITVNEKSQLWYSPENYDQINILFPVMNSCLKANE